MEIMKPRFRRELSWSVWIACYPAIKGDPVSLPWKIPWERDVFWTWPGLLFQELEGHWRGTPMGKRRLAQKFACSATVSGRGNCLPGGARMPQLAGGLATLAPSIAGRFA